MAVIKVPKTPKSAFNPARKPSSLIRAQIEHLEAAAKAVAPQAALARSRPGTEGQAAAYIASLTAAVARAAGGAAAPAVTGTAPLAVDRRAVTAARTERAGRAVVRRGDTTASKSAKKAKKARKAKKKTSAKTSRRSSRKSPAARRVSSRKAARKR